MLLSHKLKLREETNVFILMWLNCALHTLDLHGAACQLHPNKAGTKGMKHWTVSKAEDRSVRLLSWWFLVTMTRTAYSRVS